MIPLLVLLTYLHCNELLLLYSLLISVSRIVSILSMRAREKTVLISHMPGYCKVSISTSYSSSEKKLLEDFQIYTCQAMFLLFVYWFTYTITEMCSYYQNHKTLALLECAKAFIELSNVSIFSIQVQYMQKLHPLQILLYNFD